MSGFQEAESSGNSTKSSMTFDGVNTLCDACVDCLLKAGALDPGLLSYCGLGRAEAEEDWVVVVEARDISFCDLR